MMGNHWGIQSPPPPLLPPPPPPPLLLLLLLLQEHGHPKSKFREFQIIQS